MAASRRAVTQKRPRAACHHGGELPRTAGQPAVSDGIDALMDADQLPSRMAPRDAVRRESDLEQLAPRDDTALAGGELLDAPSERFWAAFVAPCAIKVAHNRKRAPAGDFAPYS